MEDNTASCVVPTTILYVEDDATCLKAVSQALTRRGYHVWTASSADAGIAILDEQSDDIQVAILGVNMPLGARLGESGYRVSRTGELHDRLLSGAIHQRQVPINGHSGALIHTQCRGD